jgi:transglutaminase/protease-like cytokinesis protein 3
VTVTGVKLDENSLTLGVGESKTLIATVLPEKATNKTVIWTSSNPTVATILPSGLITAISEGEATIEVTTADGGFTASCKVKVGDIVDSKLPVLTTLPAAEIMHDKATLGGDISDGGYPVYIVRGICYSTAQNPTINDWKITVVGSGLGDFTSEATGLSENTTYYVRAYATNTLGTAYGNQISFTTLSPSAQVRFEREDYSPGQYKMGVFNSDNEELASYQFGASVSPYFVIPSGNHVPKAYAYDPPYSEYWYNCLPSPHTYNFQPNRKYTIVGMLSGSGDTFYIKDDGPMK